MNITKLFSALRKFVKGVFVPAKSAREVPDVFLGKGEVGAERKTTRPKKKHRRAAR